MNQTNESLSFCCFAKEYHLFERLIFRNVLEKARFAWINSIKSADNILLLGEGDGRFMEQLIARNRSSRITVFDSSPRMLSEAKSKVPIEFEGEIDFVEGDARELSYPKNSFDAIVTHFFLDCFTKNCLSLLIPRLSRALIPGGKWLLSDFVEPSYCSSAKQFRHFWGLRALYMFFGLVCGVEARKVISPLAFLRLSDLREISRISYLNGLLESSAFIKST